MGQRSVLMVCRKVQGGMKKHLDLLMQGLVRNNYSVSVLSPPGISFGIEPLTTYSCNIPDIPLGIGGLSAVLYLARLLRTKKFDIVHTHGYSAGIVGRLASLAAGNTRLIHTVHNFYPVNRSTLAWCAKKAEVWLAGHTGRIIAVSEQLRNELINMGVPQEKVITIYTGIDITRYCSGNRNKIRALLGISPAEPLAGTVARLIPAKGIDVFLKALSLLKEKGLLMTGLIIGDGPEKENLMLLARKLGISSQVHFLGQREDVPELLGALDYFVLPSRQEGFGLVLLESLYLGLPVIASNTGGIKEIITHQIDGMLFTPGDFKELAQFLVQLASNTRLREDLAKRGKETVMSRFSLEKMLDSTLLLYQETLYRKML